MMIDVRPMRKADILTFEYDGIEKDLLKTVDIAEQMQRYSKIGPSWIATLNEQQLLVGGIYEVTPNVIHCWMLFNKIARDYIKDVTDAILHKIETVFEEPQYHRIQMYIAKGLRPAEIYATRLGMRKEALMKSFGPNKEDYWIYARIKQ